MWMCAHTKEPDNYQAVIIIARIWLCLESTTLYALCGCVHAHREPGNYQAVNNYCKNMTLFGQTSDKSTIVASCEYISSAQVEACP